MPETHTFNDIDLRVMRDGLGLSASVAAEYIGGCSLSTWLQYELNALTPPREVILRICGLNDARIELKRTYIERIAAVKPSAIPFYSSLTVFKMYYPQATDVTFSVFAAISRDIYLDHLSEGLTEVVDEHFNFDRSLLLPECINCETYTVFSPESPDEVAH